MDYGMVEPGVDFAADPDTGEIRTTHHFDLVNLFSILNVNQPQVFVLSDLITFINTDPSVTRPIGNVYVGAHSGADGYVELQMTTSQKRIPNIGFSADYETIEATVFNGALSIDDATIGPTPGTHFFHFKGCGIGRDVAFLKEWKLALGSKIQVTAPRFDHGVYTDQFNGVWEYMTYGFMATSPTAIVDRDTLIQQFQNAKFTYVESGAVDPTGTLVADGPPIPPNMWDKWIPLGLDTVTTKAGTVLTNRRYPRRDCFSVPAVDGLPFPIATIPVNSTFEAKKNKFNKKIDFGSTPVPGDQSGRLAALQAFLLADVENEKINPTSSRFSPNHPSPVYKRWGYPDFPSFMSGFTWTFVNNAGSSILSAFGKRYEYSLVVGLTSPNPGSSPSDNLTDNPLLVNFHPVNPSLAQPITQLPVTDVRFFQTV
jgi:hypothetical protein